MTEDADDVLAHDRLGRCIREGDYVCFPGSATEVEGIVYGLKDNGCLLIAVPGYGTYRLADALDKVHAALSEAWTILRERQPRGSYSSYPLFWDGDKVHHHLDKARAELWAAEKPVAQQGFNEGRKAAAEVRVIDGSGCGPVGSLAPADPHTQPFEGG